MLIDRLSRTCALAAGAVVALLGTAVPIAAQHEQHGAAGMEGAAAGDHAMFAVGLGGGWRLLAMGQAFPVLTVGAPLESESGLNETEAYLTQPVLMTNVESPSSHLSLRTTLDFEGVTLPDGELTFGGWGEGFIDKRHPHTLVHELMLSLNGWDVFGGEASISAGKGFAPYGTDDPMSRPSLKYPTNHHLSQILERWTVNGAFLRGGWSVEAGVFGGSEPEGPYDLSNIESFGDSWSARVARRWGGGHGPTASWEASASYASVAEEHHGEVESTRLWNVALRHEGLNDVGRLYALAEFSRSEPVHGDGYFSFLTEAQLTAGRHQPYARVEHATRPEYPRQGPSGTPEFFRYDHDDAAIGATRWTIVGLGYNFLATRGMVSIRPFLDGQLHRVALARGPATLEPATMFGTDTFWSASVGARVFFGGGPMRMGSYGILDPMTSMNRAMPAGMPEEPEPHMHGGH